VTVVGPLLKPTITGNRWMALFMAGSSEVVGLQDGVRLLRFGCGARAVRGEPISGVEQAWVT
jgi:hypothetical protein